MMSSDVSIAYLTGSAKVTKNYFNSDDLTPRKRRSIQQMFFQPYESTEEFIYCARHTVLPLLTLGFVILNPAIIVIIPTIMVGLSVVCAALGGINKVCKNESGALFFFDAAKYLIKCLCQSLIDLVLSPLSALVMLTRGISTGLQAAGILGKHALAPA